MLVRKTQLTILKFLVNIKYLGWAKFYFMKDKA